MAYSQRNQPEGVPPLALTGERTLPDVPAENYWFRRHLAVYEWIAARCRGLRVADLACGEGYGADVLARTAAEVVGVDANPEAHDHARLRYRRPNLRFERGLVEEFAGPCDAVVFLQTIEHIRDPGTLVDRIAAAAPLAYVSTPNRLTLAPPGAEKSGNPWHLREYTLREYRELLEPYFVDVEVLGLFHAGKLRVHELAIRLGWDRLHRAARITRPFYDRFVPAISASDFALRDANLDRALDFLAICHSSIPRRAPLPLARGQGQPASSLANLPHSVGTLARSRVRRRGVTRDSGEYVGDLAVVLHSHMPYVEGFGTYPFGEEWLFDAFARSHVPVLDVAHDLTLSVTPVLADQLEAPGVVDRMRVFLAEHRIAAAERDAANGRGLAAAARAELDRYRRALERLDELDGDPLEAFRAARRDRGVALIASAATHAVLPLVATAAGRRLQLDTGLRSHRRRFGAPAGLWLPECAYEPGLDEALARAGVERFCVDLSDHESPLDSLAPVATRSGPVAFTIDWETVSLVWSARGYPSQSEYLEYHRLSPNGIRLWAVSGPPYDPDAAARAVERDAANFADHITARLGEFRSRRGAPGVVVFAIDTELLGHWWSEGPEWLGNVLRLAPGRGIRLVTFPEAARQHPGEARPLRTSSWGEGKDMRTWDSPHVADIAWAARRLELRLLAALGRGLSRDAGERAARELLALQASDWAFLDARRQAGDYPYRRAVDHAESLLEAIDSGEPPDPRMRNLAPDLRLSSLLEP